MKRVLLLGVCCAALVPCLRAQEPGNFQVGAFADYLEKALYPGGAPSKVANLRAQNMNAAFIGGGWRRRQSRSGRTAPRRRRRNVFQPRRTPRPEGDVWSLPTVLI